MTNQYQPAHADRGETPLRERIDMALAKRPWRVAVYVEGATKPVRTFPGYLTEGDAQGYADHLTAQAKQAGWTHRIRVEKAI